MNQQLQRRILALALPMILSNLTVPLLGLVDNAVIGHLEHAYFLAAVGVGVMIFNFLYYCFVFLRMGTTGLVAQAFGSENKDQSRYIIIRGVLVAIMIGTIVNLIQTPIMHIAMHFAHPTAIVGQYVQQYCHYRFYALPAALANFVFLGAFIGEHKPKLALMATVFINLIAITLDFILVFGFHMDVRGLALSAVLSQFAGALFCATIYLGKFHRLDKLNWRQLSHWPEWLKLFHMNKDIFIRTLCIVAVFAYFTKRSLAFGTNTLAANMILLNFQDILAYGLDGFANAAEALVGEAIGKNQAKALHESIYNTGVFSAVVALGFCFIFFTAGKPLINLITNINSVRHNAYPFLGFAIASPIVSVWSYWLDGIFVGATASKSMRNTMIIAMCGFFIVQWPLQVLGNSGLWFALLAFLAMRGMTMLTRLSVVTRKVTQ